MGQCIAIILYIIFQIKINGNIVPEIDVDLTSVINPPVIIVLAGQVDLRRMSTRSYVNAGQQDIYLFTQWVWCWKDHNLWTAFSPVRIYHTTCFYEGLKTHVNVNMFRL